MLPVLLFLISLVLSAATTSPPACPSHCLCDPSLQHVNCSDTRLSHIGHLQLPLSVLSLMLDQNSLGSLPARNLSTFTKLQFLAANNNNITYLANGSLCETNSLLHLFLEYNKISWIESDYFKDCHELLTLELRSNYLYVEDVAVFFQYMPGLETLDLSNNHFHNDTMLPTMFGSLKNLRFFYIDDMQKVSHIGSDFFLYVNTSHIEEFSLARNPIRSISNETFAEMLALDFLDISQMMITSHNLVDLFMVLGNTNLKTLNMKSIFRYRMSDDVIGSHFFHYLSNTNLHILHAEGNFAGFRGKLDKSSLRGLQHLHELYLDQNELYWIHGRAFAHLIRLKVLSLTHNLVSCSGRCEFLSHTLPQLTTLHLSNNALDNSLQDIAFHDSGLPKLKHLYLDNNRLRSLNHLTFILPFLVSLDLSENPISFIETGTFGTMSALKKLVMDNCMHLKSLNPKVFAGLHNLEILTLNYNRLYTIGELSWFGLNSLLELDLRNNEIGNTEGNPLKFEIPSGNLTLLDLSYNNIISFSLSENNIKSLYLKDNKISQLEDIMNIKLENLVNLDVSNNYLQTVSAGVLQRLKNISNVVLEGNPFYCDCNGLPLQHWLQGRGVESSLICYGPPETSGIPLIQASLCSHSGVMLMSLMITFLLLFLIVCVILFGVVCHSRLPGKRLFNVKSKDDVKPRQTIQTVEDDTELEESLTYPRSNGTEPLMFYSQDDIQQTI